MSTRTAGMLQATAIAAGVLLLGGCGPGAEQRRDGIEAFATVAQVLQHPRCSNCHIPGDSPLVGDTRQPHPQQVARGPDGSGSPGLPCTTCHGDVNPPASYGPHVPPGAPHWALPPPDQRMAWIGLPPAQLCAMIQDRSQNGDRDFAALLTHVSEDKLVLWGWEPGAGRVAVNVPHAEFVAAFKRWVDAGGPCPEA